GPQAGGDPVVGGGADDDHGLQAGLLLGAEQAAGADRPAGAVAGEGLQAAVLVGGEPAGDPLGAEAGDGGGGGVGEAAATGGHGTQPQGGADVVAERTGIGQGDGHSSTSAQGSGLHPSGYRRAQNDPRPSVALLCCRGNNASRSTNTPVFPGFSRFWGSIYP